MLIAIGLTLLFASATAALGIHSAYLRRYTMPALWPWPLVTQGGIMIWFFCAGVWALFRAH